MKNWFSNLLAETKQEGRNAFVIALVIGLAALITSIASALLAAGVDNGWRVVAIPAFIGGLGIVSLFAERFARRNQVVLSMGLVVGMLCVAVFAISLLVSGLGVTLGVSVTLVILTISALTLSGPTALGMNAVGAIAGTLCLLTDLFWPSDRLVIPALQTAIQIAAFGVVLILGTVLIRQMQTFSLRNKLVIGFVGLAVLSVVSLAFITNRVVRAEVTKEVGTNITSLAKSHSLSVAETLQGNINELTILTLNKLVQDTTEEANASNPSSVGTLTRLDQQWQGALDSDPIVQNVINNEVSGELTELQSRFPTYAEIVVTDKYGATISATSRQENYYMAGQDWWQAAWNDGNGGVYISSGPELDERDGHNEIIFALPMPAHEGNEPIGVIFATVDISQFNNDLTAAQFGTTGAADLIFANERVIGPELVVEDPEPGTFDFVGNANNNFNLSEFEGVPSVVSVFPVSLGEDNPDKTIENLGWSILVYQAQSEAFLPASAATRSALLTSLAVLALAISLAFFLGYQFTNPLNKLIEVAARFGDGDLTAHAEVTSSDEVGALAIVFNKMSAQLKNTLDGLEQTVADRTKELEAAQLIMSKRATELQSVAEISTRASQAATAQDMLQTVVDLAKSSYNLYHAHIYLLDDTGTNLVLAAGAGEAGAKMVSEKRSIALDHQHSLVARAARSNKGAISNDVTQEPDFLPNPLLPDTKAEMAIPLTINEKVLGVLDVQADYINRFTDEDISIKTTLAQQVAASLESLRQSARSQKVARELAVVASVSTATATITDTDRLLQEVVDRTKEAFNLYHVHIYLLNEAKDTLVLASGAGDVGKQMVSEGRQIPLASEKSLVARAARTRVGAVVNDVQSEPDFLPHPLLPNTRSEQAVPMIVGDHVLGVLDVQSEQLNRFTEIDVNIKTTLAAQVAVALQNARTFSEAHRQAERESMLNTIGQKIQSATSVEAVLQIAARELGRALEAPLTIAQLGMRTHATTQNNGNGHNSN
jgi:GAF domain-containing protein/HAMP domain-containing protein